MPRKSAASLSVVASIAPEARLPVPEGMPDGQARVWRETVSGLPASWFGVEQAAILTRYCVHVDRCQQLEAHIAGMEPSDPDYTKMVLLVGQESGRVNLYARSMRLTQQSRLKAETAATRAKGKAAARPWENAG